MLPLTTGERYMHRCLQLARQGAGYVAPNPMVGAVLVSNERIIGEGYHEKFGGPHAEVNCIRQAIDGGHEALISQSALYVSLEPCSHFGKTPPCADLIIKHKIPEVVIGCRDPFTEVNGKGIEKLKAAGINVETGILEKECIELNKRFFVFHTQHRPYIILKWAQTADGIIATPDNAKDQKTGSADRRLLISNEYTNRMVHKWRSEEAGILVGTNTVRNDNPVLSTRLWPGHSPIRLVVDMKLKLPSSLEIFNGKQKTILFNTIRHTEGDNLSYYQVTEDVSLVHQILNALYQLKIQSVIVEGGAVLLQSFIDENAWDEIRVITNEQLSIGAGLKAPTVPNVMLANEQRLFSDTIKTCLR